jgi:hypothetical protein
MAVLFIRKSLIGLLLLTFLLGHLFANESDARRGGYELARKNFMQALAVMGEVVESCGDKAKVIDIPHWKEIGISRESLLLGVAYFNLKRINECTDLPAKDLLLASKVYELASPRDWEKEPSRKFVDMIIDSWWKELKAETQYRSQVPIDNQEKIKTIFELNKPFDMINSWKASGN